MRKFTIHYEIDMDKLDQEEVDRIRNEIVQELAAAVDAASKGHAKGDHDKHTKAGGSITW